MRKMITISVMFFSCFFLFASADGSVTEDDIFYLKAHGVYSNVNLAGSFVQTKEMKNSARKFKSYGDVIISPSNGIAWFTKKPYESVLVIAKDHLSQKIRNNQPVRTDVSENPVYAQIAGSIECVFFGDFETMLKVFDACCNLSEGIWSLILTPKDKLLSLFVDSIEISGRNEIESLRLLEASGDSILYEFENLTARELTDEENSVWQM